MGSTSETTAGNWRWVESIGSGWRRCNNGMDDCYFFCFCSTTCFVMSRNTYNCLTSSSSSWPTSPVRESQPQTPSNILSLPPWTETVTQLYNPSAAYQVRAHQVVKRNETILLTSSNCAHELVSVLLIIHFLNFSWQWQLLIMNQGRTLLLHPCWPHLYKSESRTEKLRITLLYSVCVCVNHLLSNTVPFMLLYLCNFVHNCML